MYFHVAAVILTFNESRSSWSNKDAGDLPGTKEYTSNNEKSKIGQEERKAHPSFRTRDLLIVPFLIGHYRPNLRVVRYSCCAFQF